MNKTPTIAVIEAELIKKASLNLRSSVEDEAVINSRLFPGKDIASVQEDVQEQLAEHTESYYKTL
ncbi:hypothetical protein SOVF_185200 [Spinacia oleracea]|nr:hypothetical protein SOVF_185200 [Spinacia oleracea]